MVLADYLDENKKLEFVRTRLRPGSIIYRHCDFTRPPKIKYLLVVQVRNDTAFFVINSEINAFILDNQHLLDSQVSILQSDHEFLDHDSYIDCTQAYYIDTNVLINEILECMDELKGFINDSTKQLVLSALHDSFSLPGAVIAELISSMEAV